MVAIAGMRLLKVVHNLHNLYEQTIRTFRPAAFGSSRDIPDFAIIWYEWMNEQSYMAYLLRFRERRCWIITHVLDSQQSHALNKRETSSVGPGWTHSSCDQTAWKWKAFSLISPYFSCVFFTNIENATNSKFSQETLNIFSASKFTGSYLAFYEWKVSFSLISPIIFH